MKSLIAILTILLFVSLYFNFRQEKSISKLEQESYRHSYVITKIQDSIPSVNTFINDAYKEFDEDGPEH